LDNQELSPSHPLPLSSAERVEHFDKQVAEPVADSPVAEPVADSPVAELVVGTLAAAELAVVDMLAVAELVADTLAVGGVDPAVYMLVVVEADPVVYPLDTEGV
jgi:hypothetical protein